MSDIKENFKDFFEEFEEKFIEYFVVLTHSYVQTLENEQITAVAKLVYSQLQNKKFIITKEEESLFFEMRKEGIMVGFLLSRAMFFFLEHLTHYINKNKPELCNYLQQFIFSMSDFVKHCETHVCDKYKTQIMHLNFDSKDNTIMGNNILDIFKTIRDKKEKIKFFNLYKGVPISHEAEVIEIDGEEVTFKTDTIQELAMKVDGIAYILKDAHFDKHIRADIVYNNFFNKTITLNNFTYLLNMPASTREYVRVHPNVSAYVNISNDKSISTKGKLYDLSANGLGVVSEINNKLFAGAIIDISFNLHFQGTNHLIETKGEILNILEYSDSYRYCIKIFPSMSDEEQIVAYVKNREEEIVKNLEDILKDYM